MAVFRIERTRDYTVMSNHHLRNHALSLKAKGLLSMMLSLPDDWNYLIFFKAHDADALTAAFSEYTQKKVKKADRSERPSVLAKLSHFKALIKNAVVDRNKRKELER